MSRIDHETKKRNKYFVEIVDGNIRREKIEREKAARKEAYLESVEYKTGFQQRLCVQNLLNPEKAWEKACKSNNSQEIIDTRFDLLRALDKAAADSVGRIMAEIMQTYLESKGQKQLIEFELPVVDFYANFKNFCKSQLAGYSIDKKGFDAIVEKYLRLNFIRIKELGNKVGYTKPSDKFEENLASLEKFVVKENELTI